MGRLADAWHRFWFSPVPLTRLAAFRIAILIVALWDAVGYGHLVWPEAHAVTEGRPTRPWNPIYLFELLGLKPIDLATAELVYSVLIAAIVLGIVGLMTRPACLVAALLSAYWVGLAYSFGKPHHDRIALTFALFALPLAPVGARLSLSCLLARGGRAGTDPDSLSGSTAAALAGVPMRLTQVTVAIGYFLAGSSKLLLGGIEWLNGYTLQGIMMGHDNVASAFFARHVELCQLFSVVIVGAQATFPLVLWKRRLLWFYGPALTGMHLTTWATMDTGSYFALWGTMLSCFIHWEKVPAALRRWLTTGTVARRVAAASGIAAAAAVLVVTLSQQLPAWAALPLLVPALVSAHCGAVRASA